MKVIYHKKEGTTVITQSYPVIEKETEVVIRLEVGALCRTDVYVHKNQIQSEEGILGHECSGIIVEKGKEVAEFELGDRVSVIPFIGCGKCKQCEKGEYQLCLDQKMLGKETYGVFSEYFKIDKQNVIKFPTETNPKKVAFFEPVLALAAVLETSIQKDSDILIYGKNRIADLTKEILHINGFQKITCEIPETEEKKYDYVIETVPNSEGFNRAIRMIKPNGTLILKSRLFNPLEVNLFHILQHHIKIESAYYYRNVEHARDMIENQLHLEHLIGETYKFEEFEKAFEETLKGESLKLYLEV